jgi:hypothetical protein
MHQMGDANHFGLLGDFNVGFHVSLLKHGYSGHTGAISNGGGAF